MDRVRFTKIYEENHPYEVFVSVPTSLYPNSWVRVVESEHFDVPPPELWFLIQQDNEDGVSWRETWNHYIQMKNASTTILIFSTDCTPQLANAALLTWKLANGEPIQKIHYANIALAVLLELGN